MTGVWHAGFHEGIVVKVHNNTEEMVKRVRVEFASGRHMGYPDSIRQFRAESLHFGLIRRGRAQSGRFVPMNECVSAIEYQEDDGIIRRSEGRGALVDYWRVGQIDVTIQKNGDVKWDMQVELASSPQMVLLLLRRIAYLPIPDFRTRGRPTSGGVEP